MAGIQEPKSPVHSEFSDPESLVKEDKAAGALATLPNGGLQAWLQVLGSFCLCFNTLGLVSAFGVYQSYYESVALATPSQISWIGSCQGAIMFIGSLVAGYVYDLGYLRSLLWVGHSFIVAGMMLTSIGSLYWHFFLTQGIMVGLGASCLFVPGVSILQQYFSTRKSLVTGIAATGNAIGGILFTIIFGSLIPAVAFAWTTRVLALLCLVVATPSILCLRLRTEPRKRSTLIDASLSRDAPYLCYCGAIAAAYAGIYVGLFYLPSNALAIPEPSQTLVSTILVFANAGSLIGRLVPGAIADHFGPLNIMMAFAASSTLLGFAWVAVNSTGGLVAWAVIYGALTGAIVTLGGPVMVAFTPDLHQIGSRLGWFGFSAGVGMLVGAPVAGQILVMDSGWIGLRVWCGSCLLLAVGLLALARYLKVGFNVMLKI